MHQGGSDQLLFVGRESLLAALAHEWDAACLRAPRLVVVSGPAGIGKTALVDRFAHGIADAAIVRVSGDAGEAAVPFGVAEQLLRHADEPTDCLDNAAAVG